MKANKNMNDKQNAKQSVNQNKKMYLEVTKKGALVASSKGGSLALPKEKGKLITINEKNKLVVGKEKGQLMITKEKGKLAVTKKKGQLVKVEKKEKSLREKKKGELVINKTKKALTITNKNKELVVSKKGGALIMNKSKSEKSELLKNDLSKSKLQKNNLSKNNSLKSQKGISLVSLVITIIILIILAGIVIINGFTDNIQQTTFFKMYNEFVEVENAVSQRGYENKLDSTVYPFLGRAYTDTNSITLNNVTYGDGYYLVTPEELETLGVTSTENQFIVNYSTGDVVLKEPFYWEEEKIFKREELLASYTNNSIITNGEYDAIKGVNKPILLDGMLPVKYDGSSWVVVSVNDSEWYDYSIDSSGGPVRYANVMLLDDTTLINAEGQELSNEKIRGMDLDNLVGMQVEDEGSMFIWLPRFTYKENSDGTRSIVYSNLTKDYTKDGYVKNPAFYYGEYTGAESSDKENSGYVAGGKELTGIWVSKYEAGYTN